MGVYAAHSLLSFTRPLTCCPPPRRVSPNEPLVLLCIAAALINQAATKKVADRHRAVLQAFAFLQEYGDCRWAVCPDGCAVCPDGWYVWMPWGWVGLWSIEA